MMTASVLILVFILCLIFHALFAGYETGFVSASPMRIRNLAEVDGSQRAKQLLYFIDRPHLMLTLLLVGENLSTVIGALALMRALEDLFTSPTIATIAAIAIAIPSFLVFSEVLPKSVFRTHPHRLSMRLIPAMRFLYFALFPIVYPLSWTASWVLRTVGGTERNLNPVMSSLEDVRSLVDETAVIGTIEPEEQKMIHSVIGLQETQAKEIMVPRIDVQAVPIDAAREALLALSGETGRTRIPVYRENIDDIVGVVNTYDILADTQPDEPKWDHFIKQVPRVPDSMKLDDLLRLLKREKQHIAVVIDEYGGTDGIVSIEDILEEIFGEIQDEHDVVKRMIRRIGTNIFIINARTHLEDVAKAIGVALEDETVETIGGWVMKQAGRIPEPGEVITHDGFRMTILEGDSNVIGKIRFEIQHKESSEHAET